MYSNYEDDMSNYQKVKELVLGRLVAEGLLEQSDMEEFNERCHVLIYKGTWFSSWFDKNVTIQKPEEKKSYYMRMIDLKEKEDAVDRLLRRTTGDYGN
jgi:hypothetical protein